MSHVNYSHKQPVQVRNGAGLQWTDGTIDKLEGRGAVVLLDNGKKSFYYWGAIRPKVSVERHRTGATRVDPEDQFNPPRPTLPPPRRGPEAPRATLGDVFPAGLKAAAAGVQAGATVSVTNSPSAPKPPIDVDRLLGNDSLGTDGIWGPGGPPPKKGLEAPITSEMVSRAEEARVDDEESWAPPPEEPLTGVKPRSGWVEKGKPRIMAPRARSTPRTPTAIGNAIRGLRINKGFTQGRLADAMPCSRTRLVNIENGDTMPDRVEVERASKALGHDPEELFKILEQSIRTRDEERATNWEPKKKGKPKRKHKTAAEKAAREQELQKIQERLDEKMDKVIAEEAAAAPSPLPPPGISHIKVKLKGVEVEGLSVEELGRLLKMMGENGT